MADRPGISGDEARDREEQQQQQQLGTLQMLPFGQALPAIVLVVESIEEDFRGAGDADSSSASSSIGASDLGENVDESAEVESPLRESESSGPLERMDALESSLPVKRGLSQFFDGKSRSFTSLKEASSVSSAQELSKLENPFKRRKMVLRSQMRSRAKSSSNLRKMLKRSGAREWSHPAFVSVSSFLPRSFSLSNVVQNV